VAVGDIVPVPGAQFGETLASASPDRGELPERVPAPRVGHPGRDGGAGDPEAAAGLVLPCVPGAPPPRKGCAPSTAPSAMPLEAKFPQAARPGLVRQPVGAAEQAGQEKDRRGRRLLKP
jgi:hypothetical protein